MFRLVGIMLQISFIIIFQISLKISSLCYSFYVAPSIIIPYLSSYRAVYSHAIMHKQHNNQRFEVGIALVYATRNIQESAHVIHIALDAPTQNRLVGTRIVCSYSVYLCYFFCIVYVIL